MRLLTISGISCKINLGGLNMVKLKYISLIVFIVTTLAFPFIVFNAPHLIFGDLILAFASAFTNRLVRFIMRNKIEDEYYKESKM